MPAAAAPSSSWRPWILGLLLGAMPTLLVLGLAARGTAWAQGVLQPRDVPVALGVLLLWLLLARTLKHDPTAARGLRWVLLVAPVPTLLAMFTLGGPITNDEQAYVFQAELMASGQLSEPLPVTAADAPLLDVFRRRQLVEDLDRGIRFSKYPPGTSLALTPFVALGLPPLSATLLLGLLDLYLVALLARRLGLGDGRLAAILLATSPFFLLVQTSLQSEVFTTPAVLGVALLLLKLRQDDLPGVRPAAVLIGLLCGWAFLVRPLTGVILALVAGCVLLTMAHGGRRKLAHLSCAVLGGLPCLAWMLWWNHHFTGEWLTSPYALYAASFGPFDPAALPARVPVDVYGKGELLPGLLRPLARWGVAFGGMLGAIGLAFLGAWRLRRRDGGFTLLLASLLPLAYAFHWYPGHRAYLGPLYVYESLGLLLLACLGWASTQGRRGHALLLSFLACGGVAFACRWPLIAEEAQARSLPQRLAATAPPGAVIFLPPQRLGSKESAFKYWTPSRPGDLLEPQARLVLRTNHRLPPARLVAIFGLEGRPLFELLPKGEAATDGELRPLAAKGTTPQGQR